MKKIILTILMILILASPAFAQVYLWRYFSHATDCTSLTGGKLRDLCYEEDDEDLYKCVPTSGDCDTTAEWHLTTGGATTDGGATTYVTDSSDSFAIAGTNSSADFFFSTDGSLYLATNDPYGTHWDGNLTVPTKDGVYDFVSTISNDFIMFDGVNVGDEVDFLGTSGPSSDIAYTVTPTSEGDEIQATIKANAVDGSMIDIGSESAGAIMVMQSAEGIYVPLNVDGANKILKTDSSNSGLEWVSMADAGDADGIVNFQEEGSDVVTSGTLNIVGASSTLTDVGGIATLTLSSGSETNDLETTDPPNVLVDEIYIGTGSGTGAWTTLSGDITNSLGATTIGADKILESHLKAVDTAVDEECLTYESTTGDFEWQTCASGETNDLESTPPPNVLINEIYIGTGSGTGAWVVASGDLTNVAGSFDIGDDKVTEAHLEAVDTASDEECLTFESATGNFEWQACGSGSLSNIVEDTTPQLGGDLDLNSFNLDFPTTVNISDVLDEDAMGTDSATALATQQSIKAYVDSQDHVHTATAITDGLIIEPDLDTDNAPVDGDILVYDSTGTNFTWSTCAEITGSADLCDGTDATGGGGGSGGGTDIPFRMFEAKVTGSLVIFDDTTVGAVYNDGNHYPSLDFQETTDSGATWFFPVPLNYDSAPEIELTYSMATATSGTVEWEASLQCTGTLSADVDVESFATTGVSSGTVPGTAGHSADLTITLTDDGCSPGEMGAINISTDADDGTNDTATGLRELRNAVFKYTGT